MGIQGLLSRLKSVSVSDSLGSYENQVVVVDAMSWLHKGYNGNRMLLTHKVAKFC